MYKNRYIFVWINGPGSPLSVIINLGLRITGDSHMEIWSTNFEAIYSVSKNSLVWTHSGRARGIHPPWKKIVNQSSANPRWISVAVYLSFLWVSWYCRIWHKKQLVKLAAGGVVWCVWWGVWGGVGVWVGCVWGCVGVGVCVWGGVGGGGGGGGGGVGWGVGGGGCVWDVCGGGVGVGVGVGGGGCVSIGRWNLDMVGFRSRDASWYRCACKCLQKAQYYLQI